MLLSKCVRWRPWALALVIQLAGWNVWALDLSQVWQLALNNDPGFKAALATEEAAREGETQAKAMLLPNVSLSHVHNQVSLQQSLGGTTTPYNYHSQNSGLSVRQSLFRKPQWDQLDQSREQIKAAQAELQRAQLDLLFRTSGYYFEMLFAKDVLEFNKVLLESSEGLLAAAIRNFEKGQTTRTDVDEAQARIDMAKAQALQARQQLQYTREQLRSVITQSVPELTSRVPSSNGLPAVTEALPVWIERTLVQHPDIVLAQAKVQAARLEVLKQTHGHLPTVDLLAQATNSQGENYYNPNSSYKNSYVGVQLNWNLYAGGQTQSAIRQALANQQREEELQEQTRRTLSLQVHKEYQNTTEGFERIKALEQGLRSADQMVISTRKGIMAGTRSQTDLFNALQRQAEAARDLAQSQYQFLLAQIKLQAMAGMNLEQVLGQTTLLLAVSPESQ
jgi:TolC family type I secretion outer membrane protein